MNIKKLTQEEMADMIARNNDSIINLTPHPITIVCDDSSVDIPPSGIVARCDEVEEFDGSRTEEIGGKLYMIPTIRKTLGAVYNLPDKFSGKTFIVSRAVISGLTEERDDVYGVGNTVRDENGRIIGCESLAR